MKPPSRKTLTALQAAASQFMLDPDASPLLGDFLGENGPVDAAMELECSPIVKQPEGLTGWLESRKDKWQDLWPSLDSAGAAKQWCEDYKSRWSFWRRQTVNEWICDDGSGGKTNPLLTVQRPVIDEVAWTIGLGMADVSYGNHPTRCKRAVWMHNPNTTGADLPKTGKNDFFKLLVYDMVISKLIEKSKVSRESLNTLFREMMPDVGEKRMAKVVKKGGSATSEC